MLSYAKSATARPGDRLNGFKNNYLTLGELENESIVESMSLLLSQMSQLLLIYNLKKFPSPRKPDFKMWCFPWPLDSWLLIISYIKRFAA